MKKNFSTRCVWESETRHSLSIGLQLTDLEEYHEIIFTVAGSSLWAGHGCQLGGRYCVEKGDGSVIKEDRLSVNTEQTNGY